MMLVQVHDVSVCCDVEISQYVASIMFALIRCLIGDAGGQASGGAHAERADKQHQGRSGGTNGHRQKRLKVKRPVADTDIIMAIPFQRISSPCRVSRVYSCQRWSITRRHIAIPCSIMACS
jgi:hypothetical protein